MPWLFTIPEFVKKRACRYLLQHYLGQYLEEKIQLEDLTIDLYNGTGTITNVPLNVEAINETLEETGAPVEVVSGYLGRVTISVPWSALMSDSCKVEVSGLTLSVMPRVGSTASEDLAAMTDSLFFGSMSSSLRIAEEVMRSGPVEGEEGGKGGEGRAAFEGMETLATAIETVLSRVQIDLKETVVQLVCRSSDYTHQYFVRLRVQSIKFYDEMKRGGGEESSVDGPSKTEGAAEPSGPAAVETKILELSDISVEVGGVGENIHNSTLLSDNLPGVPVACVSGGVSVSVKVRGADGAPVPRVQVEAVMGGIHCLLAPSQLHILSEVINATLKTRGATSESNFEQAGTGVNRPIPSREMLGMESRLKHHFREERRRRERRGDLLTADPYHNPLHRPTRDGLDFGGMTDSVTSPDMFYSLNLHDSFSEASQSVASGERSMESSICTTAASETTMGDSFISTDTRTHRGRSPESVRSAAFTEASDLESVALGGGSGLQQLSQSPWNTRRSSGRQSRTKGGGLTPHDVCKYSLTLSGVTLAVLQANPAYTHPTDTSRRENTESGQQYSSLDSSGLDPMCYLLEVAGVLRGGVNRREIQRQQEHLAQALPLDHLLIWLSTVKAGVSLQGSSADSQLTVASCELWEFLYSNTANLPHITTPVSAAPLVELSEDISLSQPCIRLKVSTSADPASRKRHKQSSTGQLVSVDLTLTSPHLNLDPTLAERLQPLLFSLSSGSSRRGGQTGLGVSQLKHSLYMTTSNFHTVSLQRQAVFNQAVSNDHHATPEQRVHLKISTASLSLSLRFPVPELNEAHRRLPWYHPSLRREVLHVTLSHLTLTSTILPNLLPHTSSVYDAYFTHANVFLSCDGSVESRELFLTVSSRGQSSATDPSRASVQLVVQPVSESVLEELNKVSHTPSHHHMLDDLGLGLEGDRNNEPHEPSPFSTKKHMYSGKGGTQSPEEDGGGVPQEHTEQLVTPGTCEEMEEFERHSSSLSQYHLSLHLPRVCLHLPSKQFLETLYFRFATDLALWRPASPEQVERANAAKSLFFSSVDIQPAATAEEKVQMCKSVLRECSEDEEDEDFGQDFLPSPPSATSCPSPGLNLLALSISVDTTRLSMILPINNTGKSDLKKRESPSNSSADDSPGNSLYASALSDPPLLPDLESTAVGGGREGEEGGVGSARETEREEDCGLAVVEISSLHFYLVSGYHGDPNHDYICAHVDQFSLAHTGSLRSLELAPFSAVLNSTSHAILSKLNHIVQRCPERLQLKPTHCGATPMILVAMDIRLEPERNSKTNKCAVALQGALLNHFVTPPALNCFTQMGEFLSLTEETVEGYEPPSLITEMHLHLQDLRLEYCPLYLPLRVLLGVTSVQLSTSLVAGSPLLVVRILVDHTHLALSNSHTHPPSLRDDYVCVLDLDWFELTLRLCNTAQFEEESQKLFSHLPEVSLECSSNVLQIHTCMDSCVALRDVLVYLASDGDLHPGPGEEIEDSGANTDSVVPHSSTSLPSSTSLDVDDDLITDAMADSAMATPTQTPPTGSSNSLISSPSEVASIGGTRTPSKSKMQVVEHGEKSLDIDFGDSDEEEDAVREGVGSGSANGGAVRGGVMAELTDAMEEDEEDGGGRATAGSGWRESRGMGEELDDNGFCLLDAPTSTYVAPGSKPVIKCLLPEGESWRIVDNHFAIPEHRVDQLQRPKHFPEPVLQYTLKELTIIWHLYGGHDLSLPPSTTHTTGGTIPQLPPQSVVRRGGRGRSGWSFSGGPGRDHSVHMELEVDKLRLQYEVFPKDTAQVSRLAFLIRDLEIRDRLAQSNINKFLYQYTTESMPRQSHANMLSLKVLTTRPEVEQANPDEEEVSIRLSVLPIRLNIDQDSFYFMFEFFNQVSDTTSLYYPPSPATTSKATPTNSQPGSTQRGQVFIRSFVFQPSLPIKIDYTTKWRFPTDTMGTLPGILISLYHLDNSELTLKSLNCKTGFLGMDSLLECVTREWSTDIMTRQLPLILKGVGPTHYITQFVHGVVDLVRLPYHQYQEDGRIVWGLQQGASSFSTSTGLAVVELTSRTLETLQSVAQMVYDLVTPVSGEGQSVTQRKAPHQPQDFREGVSNAYDVVATGLTGAAVDLYTAASQEHEERGVTGAVGGILRQIPGTVVKPVILLSEATRHVLGGVKNQFVPDARREAREKWKSVETND